MDLSFNSSLQRHEVQPDVYCRRLGLQVPVAVSVKEGQTADVFHAICSIALNPCVICVICLKEIHLTVIHSSSAVPGNADRALTPAARFKNFMTWSAVLGGLAAGVMMVYRTLVRPGSAFANWSSPWAAWILGRREL